MTTQITGAMVNRCFDIQANLRLENNGQLPKVIAITSVLPKEGKSTVAASLAMSLAKGGVSVVLLDANLSAPAAQSILGVSSMPGLQELIEGKAQLDKSVHNVEQGFDVIPGGLASENSMALIDSPGMTSLIDTLKSRYDVVLLDTPAINAGAGAVVLSLKADGAVLVIRARKTSAGRVKPAVSGFESRGVKIMGVVLNG